MRDVVRVVPLSVFIGGTSLVWRIVERAVTVFGWGSDQAVKCSEGCETGLRKKSQTLNERKSGANPISEMIFIQSNSSFHKNMLIVPDQPLALVTGVTGFLASHVAKHLLEAGFKVRGTARDDEKAKHLVDLFQNESFSIVKIEDMQKEGAFDEAVKDVQFIHHVTNLLWYQKDRITHKIIGRLTISRPP